MQRLDVFIKLFEPLKIPLEQPIALFEHPPTIALRRPTAQFN
jgi:hypothetical protein